MPKMVIEVPEEFAEVGKAMVEHLAALQRTVSRLGGGKAVDYAEMEQAMAESAGRTELAGQRAILQSLDMDLPAVIIGGVRYTRVGRCEAPYHHRFPATEAGHRPLQGRQMLHHRLSHFRKLLRNLNHHLGHHTSQRCRRSAEDL